MSNSVELVPCTFEDDRTGEKTYGFRMYDNYAKTYCNIMENPLPNSDLKALEEVLANWTDDIVISLIDHVRENENGIFIGGQHYSHKKIEKIINKKRKP